LLAFSRKQFLRPRVLDLNETVEAMGKMIKRLIGEDIELRIRTDPALGRVKVDPGQIEQIIVNLAVNSRDAMPKGGRLTIETHNAEIDEASALANAEMAPGRYVQLAIADTGEGMDAATAAHAFEPFFTTKEIGKGTGLGLSTVYGIVKQSGGWIEMATELERGTVFTIVLPRVDASGPNRAGHGESLGPPIGTETVLLVEDEADVRRLTAHALALHGYVVLEAGCGDEALRICTTYDGTIHLLVSDVVMPTIGGPELAERLSVLRPEMKRLFMSGYTHGAVLHDGVLEPGTAFLPKPFTPDELARKVRAVLDDDEM
jgi:CheY-like chemotaxis protein